MVSVPEYDLVVIGSGPAGQKGALAAAKLDKHVAVVDRTMISGVCVPTGTISSKDVRIENGAHRRSVHGRFVGRKPCSLCES